MNKEQRDQISKIIGRLSDLQSEVANLGTDEQDKFDNLSEGLQASEKGEAIQVAADALSQASDEIQAAIDTLEGIE